MSPKRRTAYVPVRRTDRNTIGRRVAALRSEQGITQEDLAGRAAAAKTRWSISRYTVKRIESGEREVTDKEIRCLAEALRVSVQELFE